MTEDKLIIEILNAAYLPQEKYKPNPYIEIAFRGTLSSLIKLTYRFFKEPLSLVSFF